MKELISGRLRDQGERVKIKPKDSYGKDNIKSPWNEFLGKGRRLVLEF